MENIYLIGFMGAGKSTVGRILASSLSSAFKDTDTIIETSQKAPISQIFRVHGEHFFRDLETDCLNDLAKSNDQVVSTGGGIIERCENRTILSNGKTVFLNVEWPQLLERISISDTRPLATNTDNWDNIYQLYCRRLPLYRQADLVVDCDSKLPDQIADEIIEGLKI